MENSLIKGDCLEILKNIPSNSINLIITDPPYNISKENNNRDRSKAWNPVMRRESKLNFDFGDWDNKTREEFLGFTKEWLKECCRVLKEGGTIISFFNKEDVSFLGWEAKNFGIRTRTIFTWHKTNPTPSFRKVNYLSACEFLWVGSKEGKTWTFNFKKQNEMHNFFQSSNGSGYKETKHPTEKPLSLIKHLIEIHSNEGDVILDCFAGSGTIGKACLETGRNFILIEKEEEYINMIKERLKDYATSYSQKLLNK
ncbi:MAG: site-specific DNA-methyltransferase [Candidatus Staskawiczbacteria bacterium]|jgi:DNA modification methylase